MTSPVLVPLDGSSAAENAIPAALMLARHLGAAVRLVQVADLEERDVQPHDRVRAAGFFSSYAEKLVHKHGGPAARWTADVVFGSPGPAILDLAREASAVVLASHGHGGFQALFLGSVADKVVRGSTVPVLVVPAIGTPPAVPREILAAVDGSPESERALALARRIAAGVGAHITIAYAFVEMVPPSPELMGYSSCLVDELRRAAEEYVASLRREGEATITPYGRAAEAIVRTARDIDAGLVVMASTGKGLKGRLLLGSTTDRVLHSLHRPLLIVPPAQPVS